MDVVEYSWPLALFPGAVPLASPALMMNVMPFLPVLCSVKPMIVYLQRTHVLLSSVLPPHLHTMKGSCFLQAAEEDLLWHSGVLYSGQVPQPLHPPLHQQLLYCLPHAKPMLHLCDEVMWWVCWWRRVIPSILRRHLL